MQSAAVTCCSGGSRMGVFCRACASAFGVVVQMLRLQCQHCVPGWVGQPFVVKKKSG
jgi:hypothetical protein